MNATYTLDQPVVYRVFDKSGRLIYIGATKDVAARFLAHGHTSWWFDLIALVTTESHPTAEAALAAEAVAIQEEQPAFNVRHTGRRGPLVTDDDFARAVRWDAERRGTGGGYVAWLYPMRGDCPAIRVEAKP